MIENFFQYIPIEAVLGGLLVFIGWGLTRRGMIVRVGAVLAGLAATIWIGAEQIELYKVEVEQAHESVIVAKTEYDLQGETLAGLQIKSAVQAADLTRLQDAKDALNVELQTAQSSLMALQQEIDAQNGVIADMRTQNDALSERLRAAGVPLEDPIDGDSDVADEIDTPLPVQLPADPLN